MASKIVTWVLAFVAAAFVIKGTRIGPVIATIDAERGWGVHTGDALVVVPFAVAALVTARLSRR